MQTMVKHFCLRKRSCRKFKIMIRKIITFILITAPLFAFAQPTKSIVKIVNGKPCDSCEVIYFMETGNTMEYAFIENHVNSHILSKELNQLKKSVHKADYEQRCYVTRDSIINLSFLGGVQNDLMLNSNSFLPINNINYKDIRMDISINNKSILSNIAVTDLQPRKDYIIRKIKYNQENGEGKIVGNQINYSIGQTALKINDIISIKLFNTKTRKNELSLYIKRVYDSPTAFMYYEAPIGKSASLKESVQTFIAPVTSISGTKNGDSTHSFSLESGNLGVFVFSLGWGDNMIEYKFLEDKNWKGIQRDYRSSPEKAYLILDDTDILPGKTRTLMLRYKNLPGSIHTITLQGISLPKQISSFTIVLLSLLIFSVFGIIYFIKQLRHKKQVQKLHQKNKNIETQLSLLSGQLNPHFLFNSLYAIQGIINSKNTHEANSYISHVATFMRNIMDYGKKEFISLTEELQLEEDYMQLEQKRRGFQFHSKVDNGMDATKVDFPPLLLQPVLENSLRHAFTNTVKTPTIIITAFTVQTNLIITIKDNGTGWNTVTHPEGHGMGLVRKRIALLNEKMPDMQIEITIDALQNEGTTTTFTFKNWIA